jgi:hypothetical protein
MKFEFIAEIDEEAVGPTCKRHKRDEERGKRADRLSARERDDERKRGREEGRSLHFTPGAS